MAVRDLKQFVFANLIVILKKYANNPSDSFQLFLTDLFDAIGKNDDEYDIDMLPSNTSSRIMTRQYDVPNDIRNIINKTPRERIKNAIACFCNDKINIYEKEKLFNELLTYINNSFNISPESKQLLNNATSLVDLITDSIIMTVRLDNRLKINEEIWCNGNNKIKLVSGDLMALSFNSKEKGIPKIVVIPIDVDNHLHVSGINESNPEVSIKTLHGMWLKKMEQYHSIAEIQRMITENVINPNEIGSISKVCVNAVMFYLVSLSKFDAHNKANSNIDNLKKCIQSILEEYDNSGQGYPLYIPLLGTGRSRIGLSYEESIKIIKDECLKHKNKIQGEIHIIIYTKNLEEILEAKNDL